MITIQSPNELPLGVDLWMTLVKDETEAAQITGTGKAYLFKSKIVDGLYLFRLVIAPARAKSPLWGETETR